MTKQLKYVGLMGKLIKLKITFYRCSTITLTTEPDGLANKTKNNFFVLQMFNNYPNHCQFSKMAGYPPLHKGLTCNLDHHLNVIPETM